MTMYFKTDTQTIKVFIFLLKNVNVNLLDWNTRKLITIFIQSCSHMDESCFIFWYWVQFYRKFVALETEKN